MAFAQAFLAASAGSANCWRLGRATIHKYKMADKQEKTESAESAESAEKQSEEKRTEDSVLPVDLFSRRYTLDECREIGKGMLEALKTAIQPEEVGYIPALQEPHAKAWKYLEESHALLLMEGCSTSDTSSCSLISPLYKLWPNVG
ncbi:uncharacterized protein LOC5509713 isoform X2 [Nematostella vectensis]|uniref:uncharacterized protein LOC5509713 isoform X2 n=1 Tax=Nematostella vectensis TaxID=45351 RepID=UPI0020778597|nr:uncharacterized protein LOC5509713 isoform X2 [Nematostella vectensis]